MLFSDYAQFARLKLTFIIKDLWHNCKKIRDWYCGYMVEEKRIDWLHLAAFFECALQEKELGICSLIWRANRIEFKLWYSGGKRNVGSSDNPVFAEIIPKQMAEIFKLSLSCQLTGLNMDIWDNGRANLFNYYRHIASDPTLSQALYDDFIFYLRHNCYYMLSTLIKDHPTFWSWFCGGDLPANVLVQHFTLLLNTKNPDYYLAMWMFNGRIQECIKQLDVTGGKKILRAVLRLESPAFSYQFLSLTQECAWAILEEKKPEAVPAFFAGTTQKSGAQKRAAEWTEFDDAPPMKALKHSGDVGPSDVTVSASRASASSSGSITPNPDSFAELGFFAETAVDRGDLPLPSLTEDELETYISGLHPYY